MINIHSDLYHLLIEENKTQNLILYENNGNYNSIFEYLLNSKIIVSSYDQTPFRIVINSVSYIKYLYINHGITYYKSDLISPELETIKIEKRNIITSSPFEYTILLNKFNYSSNYIYKAGLARYDRYNNDIKNNTNKKCILAFFTYRKFNNTFFQNSLYKKNIENLINDELLINYLQLKNIDFILIQHHLDILYKKTFNRSSFSYVKILNHIDLNNYISQCSLFITDFSSVSFAFMFQNKPILYYLIDYKDNNDFLEKKFMKINDPLQFGYYYLDKNEIIEKIQYYIDNDFQISEQLKNQYESVFYYKYNITGRIHEIINEIINV